MLVKICGVRCARGARACATGKADLAGLNFVTGTRRAITVQSARALLPHLGAVKTVGVFRDQTLDEVLAVADALALDWVQLHGEESPDFCASVAQQYRVIKALTLEQVVQGQAERLAPHAQAFLVDGRQPGSGARWGWHQIAPLKGALEGRPLWLAGGLGPDNITEAIAQASPAGVDVASGVEEGGAQNPEKILAFCRRARGGLK